MLVFSKNNFLELNKNKEAVVPAENVKKYPGTGH
jgi:hypothetical protein